MASGRYAKMVGAEKWSAKVVWFGMSEEREQTTQEDSDQEESGRAQVSM